MGTRYPWKPKPFFELVEGNFIDNAEKEYTLDDIKSKTVIGFYFSAHWCGPCRAFTPSLIKLYNKLKEEGKSFEIVFASSDEDQAGFNDYFSTMPWKAIPYGDPRERLLKQKFGVRGIPSLILVDGTGKVISTQGRSLVEEDPTGFPWASKPFTPLGKACLEVLNTQPVLLFFPLESKVTEQTKVLQEIAEEYYKKFEDKSKDEDHPLTFLYDSNNKDILIPRICQAFSLPQSRPLLCIVDVNTQLKYIHQGEITATAVREFIENYLSDKLQPTHIREY
jgi:nucleoredoxin